MTTKRKLTLVQQAYERCKPARDLLVELDARCIEATEDKAGILWERWLVEVVQVGAPFGVNAVSVILFATPHWWDVFAPMTDSVKIEETLDAIRAFTQKQ